MCSEEELFIAQSAFHSVRLPDITRSKESKNGPLSHFAGFILLSILRSTIVDKIY